MARPSLAEKDILNPSEAIEYFVLSRRKFYDLLNNTDGEDFLAYYGERKLILRVAFEREIIIELFDFNSIILNGIYAPCMVFSCIGG